MKKILLFFVLCLIFIPKVSCSTSSAHSYVLMDAETGRVLDSKNMNDKSLIASITKIMTAVITIESNKLDELVTVDESILSAYGSGIYIQVGEEMLLKDMLYGLMLRSGNDAAVMIATYVAGSEEAFVNLMNDKAKKIGMKNTTFVNSSGLDNTDSGNYSTAYDMSLLTRYAMQYDEYREIVKTKEYTVKTNYKTYVWHNKNKLLNYDYVTGGKTGYTEKAGRTLVSTASKDDMNLIVVTIRDSDDWNTHIELYNYAFSNYTSYKVLNKDNFNIIGDTYYNNDLYIKEDLYIPLKNSETGMLISKIKLEKLKNYKQDDKVGYIEIYIDDELLATKDIYINKKDENKTQGFWSKLWEWIKFW